VADLTGLGHREEFEAVEPVLLAAEVGVAHLGRLLLYLVRLCLDCRLLALEPRHQCSASPLRLPGFVTRLRGLLGQRLVVGTQHAAQFAHGVLRGHGKPEDFRQFVFQLGECCRG
jgi:hypothetical protein